MKYAEARENNSYLIHISEADKIIDLETGEYITDNDLKDKIKSSGKIPETQYAGYYNYKTYKIDVEEPQYAEYRKNIPQGWEVEETLIVPRSCGKIVFVLEKWIENGCYQTLYDGNDFIVPPKSNKRLVIDSMFQGKCFVIYDVTNSPSPSNIACIVDAYGRVILEPQSLSFFNRYGKDIFTSKNSTKRVVFEY